MIGVITEKSIGFSNYEQQTDGIWDKLAVLHFGY